MKVEVWTFLFVTISFIIYLYIGWRSRVRDSKGFFVADQGVPAIAGMSIGLAFSAFYIIGVKFYGMQPWFFGISPEGIGTVGMGLNFMVTLVVSALTSPPPLEVQQMVEELRTPEHEPLTLSD